MPKKEEYNHSSNSTSSIKRNGGGVADYFAILGIGETLELKSTQKKYQRVCVSTNVQNEDEKKNRKEALLQEEECAMIERFFREIVEVSILTAYTQNGVFVGGSLATTVGAVGNDSGDDDDNQNNDGHYYRGGEEMFGTRPTKKRDITSTIVHSPNTLKTRKFINDNQQAGNQATNNNNINHVQPQFPKEISGFNIIYQTIPMEDSNNNDQKYHPGIVQSSTNNTTSDMSFNTDQDISMSLSLNTTVDTIDNNNYYGVNQISAMKGQSLDADLNFEIGLLSTLLSQHTRGVPPDISSNSYDNSIPNIHVGEKNANNSIPSQSFDSQTDHHDNKHNHGDNTWNKLNFRNGIQKKIRDQIILATKTKADVIGDNDKKIVLNKHYYIGYRRRGADETDKPAVADVVIKYCRVHKSTIIRSEIEQKIQQEICSNGGNIQSGSSTVPPMDTNLTNQIDHSNSDAKTKSESVLRRGLGLGANIAKRVAVSGKNRILRTRTMDNDEKEDNYDHNSYEDEDDESTNDVFEAIDDTYTEQVEMDTENHKYDIINLHEVLELPEGYEHDGEWIIPCGYKSIKIPIPPPPQAPELRPSSSNDIPLLKRTHSEKERILAERRMRKTYLFNHRNSPSANGASGMGIETFVNGDSFLNSNSSITPNSPDSQRRNPWSPVNDPPVPSIYQSISKSHSMDNSQVGSDSIDRYYDHVNQETFMPCIISNDELPDIFSQAGISDEQYEYIPIIAVRRQRLGEEERFHEDPGMIDIALSFSDHNGKPLIPAVEEIDEFDEKNEEEDEILGKSNWSASSLLQTFDDIEEEVDHIKMHSLPTIIFQHNMPLGFVDTPFATSVLDRFPRKDYKGVPLPQEELPMFCYPTGCRLFRARYQDAPLAEYYGFVVKNERGDNIHVSCVSFMEPLQSSKFDQLDQISEKKRKTSLAHKRYCERKERALFNNEIDDKSSFLLGFDDDTFSARKHLKSDLILTGFEEMMTFELKTICLISRYPFWSAFRRFLSHLHILSGSSSDLPLERYISHLLLSVPVPKPGAQCIIIPLPAIASPMVLSLPPAKDMPLLDLPCHRLFSCLDAPTVVTIVLGFLTLERKVIIMSSYPSLVSDVCEILRSLLFPFELCAPYVPRLTEPFMSCLQFPGAIFVGIHDDGCENGLATSVRKDIPEDAFIVDLDTGDIDCNGDRYEVLKDCWDIIPSELRSLLVEEIETLCQDARLVPGQEPLGIEIEAALDVSVIPTFGDDDDDEMLDDRAIRDCFLRFYCSILGGYERYLLVPDMDFVISGNEWFDAKGFLNSVVTQSRSAFLHSFVTTQLFQSFIQRRTEASDVRCLLFDECLAEFHSSRIPYGRLSKSFERTGMENGNGSNSYDLLVDQCAAEIYDFSEADEASSAEMSILTAHTIDGFMVNNSGDFVTAPSRKNLPFGMKYVYCLDGHPHFPQKLDSEMFFPKEPECLSANLDVETVPILTRSDRELDVSKIRRKSAMTHRGVQRQRRCLLQLPKLMGSHFLNSWLMCIPSQVSQHLCSSDQQQSYILRALGALRTLRSRLRIVPDEAGYRSLIVACGRTDSDRRQEIVKLFGLLRSDGIFPSAVTLGQYTRAIAEGYSKRSVGNANSSIVDQCHVEEEIDKALDMLDSLHPFNFLDGNLLDLEDAGRRWRSRRDAKSRENKIGLDGLDNDHARDDKGDDSHFETSEHVKENKKGRRNRRHKSWSPVTCSSSFSPHWKALNPPDESFDLLNDFQFTALWSRTTVCHSCTHILLDEEIQAGWDEVTESDVAGEIRCPCCGASLQPQLGFMNHPQTNNPSTSLDNQNKPPKAFEEKLPPQLQSNICPLESSSHSGYVPYLNPSRMRKLLEEIVKENGEEILQRETLRNLNPVVFFNLWWFCCRFSLPLPLAVSAPSTCKSSEKDHLLFQNCHWCAFAAWDKSLALAGCQSGAKAVRSIQALIRKKSRPKVAPSFQNLVKTFDPQLNNDENGQSILSEDFPFLSSLDLQSLAQGDWDNDDLSAVLVTLVEACDKRDFLPVLKAVLQCNMNRISKYGRHHGVELECYQTLMYLTRYQCTSAFHKFFHATCRVCKGYHFWCPNSTVTIFDRMFREASDRLRAQGILNPIVDVSDIALGFRSVFGHII